MRASITAEVRLANLFFLELKSLHRSISQRVWQAKDVTGKLKQQIDDQHLQLQNLLYEKSYLQKEIRQCRDFRCVHTLCSSRFSRTCMSKPLHPRL